MHNYLGSELRTRDIHRRDLTNNPSNNHEEEGVVDEAEDNLSLGRTIKRRNNLNLHF